MTRHFLCGRSKPKECAGSSFRTCKGFSSHQASRSFTWNTLNTLMPATELMAFTTAARPRATSTGRFSPGPRAAWRRETPEDLSRNPAALSRFLGTRGTCFLSSQDIQADEKASRNSQLSSGGLSARRILCAFFSGYRFSLDNLEQPVSSSLSQAAL